MHNLDIKYDHVLQVNWSALVFCRMVENTNSKSDIDVFNLMIQVHGGWLALTEVSRDKDVLLEEKAKTVPCRKLVGRAT